MIASDDNNPNFVGARNPDAGLHVTFYKKSLPNEFLSKKEERPIFYECDFVKIIMPGNQLFNVDTFVNDTHKQRFPLQWARYVNSQKAEQEEIIGTPIAEWPAISRSVAEELRALKFYSVESIANASDSQIQSMGMKAGMQPHALREKAQRFLAMANQAAEAGRAEAAEARATAAEEAIAEMRAQMAQLQAAAGKGKPGRKPKQTEAA